MQVPIEEFKNNIDKYLTLADTEGVNIIENGRVTKTLLSPKIIDRVITMRSIFGSIQTDEPISLDESRRKRLSEKLGYEV